MRLSPLLAAATILGLAACDTPRMADFDPHHRFQSQVTKRHAVAALAPSPDGRSLSATDLAVITDLAREHLRRGAGAVQVRVSGDAANAYAQRVVAALDSAGIGQDSVETTFVSGAGVATAEIRVPIWVAEVPECGIWPDRISPDYQNQNTANFGCAVTRNIGLMVANPADLVRAREASARSGARADDILTKYGAGKPTASQAEETKPAATLSTVGTK